MSRDFSVKLDPNKTKVRLKYDSEICMTSYMTSHPILKREVGICYKRNISYALDEISKRKSDASFMFLQDMDVYKLFFIKK